MEYLTSSLVFTPWSSELLTISVHAFQGKVKSINDGFEVGLINYPF